MATTGYSVQSNGDIYKLDLSAKDTAVAFEFFDELFDTFNASGASTKKLKCKVKKDSAHWEFWRSALQIIERVFKKVEENS
ncbi:hypothetical protein RN001_001535 [Aquatica leii]|uniref:Uncharacterized protein n=1 Tax=Aquatica leii TaxID=1421715 RepID=A0AAN7PG23_9COLE|nr:hypothetical protein RN001_001535 [Aquatica leii]